MPSLLASQKTHDPHFSEEGEEGEDEERANISWSLGLNKHWQSRGTETKKALQIFLLFEKLFFFNSII